jgi:sulfonate transport system permease protein
MTHSAGAALQVPPAQHEGFKAWREVGRAPARQASRGAGSSAFWRRLAARGAGLLLPLMLLLAWESASALGWVSRHLLPPPSALAQTLVELAGSGLLLKHILISTGRVGAGFAIGASAGVLLGAAVALSRPLSALLDPSLQALRAIPSLAWVPLLLLWLGIDESPKITLIAIGAFFPVYLATVSGIQNVDRKLVEVGELLGFSRATLFRRILGPAALPSVFTGQRTALGLAWMFLVAAELIAATKGLGYLLSDGRETGRVDLVLVAILVLALLGKFTDSLLKFAEARALHWRDAFQAKE